MKNIPDVPGLPDQLLELLEKEVECPWLTADQADLDHIERMTRAINYLQGLSWENVPETSWQSMIPNYLRQSWGNLSYREMALIYIMTVSCPAGA